MDRKNYISAVEFEAELIDGIFDIPDECRNELKKIKSGKVLVTVQKNIEEELFNFSIDVELFERIEKVQRLPLGTVLDFLTVKGEIHDKDFLDRIKNER